MLGGQGKGHLSNSNRMAQHPLHLSGEGLPGGMIISKLGCYEHVTRVAQPLPENPFDYFFWMH